VDRRDHRRDRDAADREEDDEMIRTLDSRRYDGVIGPRDRARKADCTLVGKATNVVIWSCLQQNGPPPPAPPRMPPPPSRSRRASAFEVTKNDAAEDREPDSVPAVPGDTAFGPRRRSRLHRQA
jgi:hypothetical protein